MTLMIWLHNIHGYYRVEVLFDYLKAAAVSIKWTLHDAWSFTGHCAYFFGGGLRNGPAAANARSWVPTRPARASAMWHATTPAKGGVHRCARYAADHPQLVAG